MINLTSNKLKSPLYGFTELNENVLVTQDDYIDYMAETQRLSGITEFAEFQNYVNSTELGKLKDKKFVKVAKNVIQKANKVNPATIAVRNALRGLIALNFIGMASAMQAKSEVKKKVEEMYKNMGGNLESLNRAIGIGAKKKPLFNKDATNYKGLGDGGVTVASLLTAAGAFVAKIWGFMKDAGIKVAKKDDVKNIGAGKTQDKSDKSLKNKAVELFKKITEKSGEKQKTHDNSDKSEQSTKNEVLPQNIEESQPDPKNKNKKIYKRAAIAIGVPSLAIGGYFLWKHFSKNKVKKMPGKSNNAIKQGGHTPLGKINLK